VRFGRSPEPHTKDGKGTAVNTHIWDAE